MQYVIKMSFYPWILFDQIKNIEIYTVCDFEMDTFDNTVLNLIWKMIILELVLHRQMHAHDTTEKKILCLDRLIHLLTKCIEIVNQSWNSTNFTDKRIFSGHTVLITLECIIVLITSYNFNCKYKDA